MVCSKVSDSQRLNLGCLTARKSCQLPRDLSAEFRLCSFQGPVGTGPLSQQLPTAQSLAFASTNSTLYPFLVCFIFFWNSWLIWGHWRVSAWKQCFLTPQNLRAQSLVSAWGYKFSNRRRIFKNSWSILFFYNQVPDPAYFIRKKKCACFILLVSGKCKWWATWHLISDEKHSGFVTTPPGTEVEPITEWLYVCKVTTGS